MRRAGSVAEAIEQVVAAGLLGRRLVVALLAPLLALAGDDDADLGADPAVLRLLELGARDAVGALLALGHPPRTLVVAAAGVAHARGALGRFLLGEREVPEVLDVRHGDLLRRDRLAEP